MCKISFLSAAILFAALFQTPVKAQWTSGGLLVSDGVNDHYRSKQCPHPSGGIYTAWLDMTVSGDEYIVKITALCPDGNIIANWPVGGINVCSAGDHYAPEVCTTSDSCVIVSWYGIIPSHSTNEHIWAQKFSADGNALWNSGNPVLISQTDTFHHKYPMLAADDNGGAYIVWNRYDLAISASSVDIMLHHVLSDGSMNTNWNNEGCAVADVIGTREYYPRHIVSNDRKKIYVLYAQGLIGGTSMRIQKVFSADGVKDALWPAQGVILSPGGNIWASIDKEQYLFIDSTDKAVAFWLESKLSANGEVYMQKIDSTGNIHLASGGVRVGGTTTDGTGYVHIIQNQNNQYFLAYNNYTVWYDITAKKIDNQGNNIWQTMYVTTDNNSAYPWIAHNDEDGIYIFYKRLSPAPTSLYAISVNSTGQISNGWTLSGSDFGGIGTYSGFFPHRDFSVSAGTEGNAFVVWNRLDSGLYKLYACNLFQSGLNCSPTTEIEQYNTQQIISVYPNPFDDYVNFSAYDNIDNAVVQLYDITGKLVLQSEFQQHNSIGTQMLNKGMYLYIVKSEHHILQKGIIMKQ